MIGFIKKHYHWIIAAALFIEMAIYGGMLNNLSSLFVIPVTTSLQVSRSVFSIGMSAKGITNFLSTILSGPLFHRFGCKKMTLLGLIVASIAMLLMSSATNITTIIIGSGIIGMCDGFCCTGIASVVISKWFHRFQGTILGIVTAATGIGGSLLCMVLSSAIAGSGWQTAYRITAIAIFSVAVLLLLVLKDHPSQMGLRPYGIGYMPRKKTHHREDDHWQGYTSQELYRKPTAYLLMITIFFSSLVLNTAYSLVLPHFQDQGLSAAEAASLQSWLLIFLTISKTLFGTFCDKLGPRLVSIIAMVLAVFSIYLISCTRTYSSAMLSIALLSFSLPVTTILIPLLTYPLFGYQSHNSSLGVFLSMVSIGNIVNSPLANIVYDLCGSYTPVLQLLSGLSAVSVALYGVLFFIAAGDKKKYQALHNESPV